MSQHDFNIANQGFPATRADLNNALAALASTSSGDTEPSTTYANQLWYDTSNNLLKFRNEADSAWITFAYLDQASNEWEIRSAVIQAVDSAGVVIKTDDGTTRLTVADDGDVAIANDLTVTGTISASNVPSVGALSNRNLLINSAMQVAQRGTSQTVGGYGSVDRWYIDNTADGGGQVADAPDDFEYSLKVNPNSGNATVRQAIELPAAGKGGVFRSGQTFTLSFWLKSDNAGEVINIFIASSTSVSGSTTTHVNDTSTGLTTSTSWTRYTYTYTQASNVGGSDTCYNIVPYVSSPSGAIYLTGVSLEVGDTATPFEHEPYSVTLQKCQRYYQLTGGSGAAASASLLDASPILSPEMRAAPTVSIGNGTNGCVMVNRAVANVTSISSVWATGNSKYFGIRVNSSDTGMTSGAVSWVFGSVLAADAEL